LNDAREFVMAGLVPAIHVFGAGKNKTWMPGTRPGMTLRKPGLSVAKSGTPA